MERFAADIEGNPVWRREQKDNRTKLEDRPKAGVYPSLSAYSYWVFQK
jgi:hypothetical protein